MAVQNLYTLREIIKAMRETYHMSWREIGQEEIFAGVSFGTLNAIYHGREPGNKARKKLGLQSLIPTEACTVHGVAHPGICPDDPNYKVAKRRKPPTKPRVSYKKLCGELLLKLYELQWREI